MIIFGKVLHGKKRGRRLGYPTANTLLHKNIDNGIYISIARFRKINFPAVTFIGNATTFGEPEIFAETHILNFDKNIYNKWLKVRLLKKIRDSEKFKGEAALIKKMKEDIEEAKQYFQMY